jgi:RNA polymerase sigma-70 factor (ECF subfamily)
VSKKAAVENLTELELRFDLLFGAHYQAIYRYCVRRLGRSDAEDATADVFAVAWRRLDQMPPDDKSRAWLFGVAYRVVGNQYRGRLRQSRLSTRLHAVRTADESTEQPETGGEDVERLLTALDRLSASDQELLRLSSWDGLTRNEIAYVLGITENAVDQRLHRARSRLKTRFDHLNTRMSPTESKETST